MDSFRNMGDTAPTYHEDAARDAIQSLESSREACTEICSDLLDYWPLSSYGQVPLSWSELCFAKQILALVRDLAGPVELEECLRGNVRLMP